VPLDERVEVGEEPIEDVDHLGRGQALRERGEVHDVSEQDRGLVEVVGDRSVGGLQAGSDRAGQDVHEEGLGLLLLDSDRHEGLVALVGEGGEEHEGDGSRPDDVQRQHGAREPQREVRIREEHLAEDPRKKEDGQERDEPTDGLTHVEEDEGSHGSEDAPESDRAGGEKTTHEHLTAGRRRDEDVEELHGEEEPEVLGSREHHQGRNRDSAVDERSDAHPRAEGEVQDAPDDGHGCDEDRQQDEERLLLAQLLVVPRIRANPAQGRRHTGHPAGLRGGIPRRGHRLLGHERHRTSTGGCVVVPRRFEPRTCGSRERLRTYTDVHRRTLASRLPGSDAICLRPAVGLS
jgi:hypothetical protein